MGRCLTVSIHVSASSKFNANNAIATDSKQNAGLSYIRVPLAASDFSPYGEQLLDHAFVLLKVFFVLVYSFDDTKGDTSLSKFSTNGPASNVMTVIKDIKGINSAVKIHLLPWSPVSQYFT